MKLHDTKMHVILLFQLKSQNAPLILNAQIILHAYVKNVKTPASPLLVESMLNAGEPDIEQFAIANKVMREIPTVSVKNVSNLSIS